MMNSDVKIGMMTSNFILWRCLHGGPLSADTILQWEENSALPWIEFQNRNIPLLAKLSSTYGACAVTASHGNEIVGHLRFYPKAVLQLGMSGTFDFCLQQKYPSGPADDFHDADFPPFKDLKDRTLIVHCLMTGSQLRNENPFQRKGVGTSMVKFLINWASRNGWTAIEAKTYEDIPLLYAVSGNAGKTFWEKLNFYVLNVSTEEVLLRKTAFAKAVRDSAKEAGIDPALIANTYMMRFEL